VGARSTRSGRRAAADVKADIWRPAAPSGGGAAEGPATSSEGGGQNAMTTARTRLSHETFFSAAPLLTTPLLGVAPARVLPPPLSFGHVLSGKYRPLFRHAFCSPETQRRSVPFFLPPPAQRINGALLRIIWSVNNSGKTVEKTWGLRFVQQTHRL